MSRLLLFLLLGPAAVFAQFNNAIQGLVTDSTGAAVPSAAITVTQTETGIVRNATTTADGYYRVLSLGPGVYTMSVTRTGFGDTSRAGIRLGTGETIRADITLQVSTLQERVTVAADVPLVETEQGRVSGRIEQVELKEMPLNGRNLFNLLALQPGMTGRSRSLAEGGGSRPGNDPFSGEASPQVYASGQRYEANSFSMDGTSINSGVRGGYTNITPSAEAVQEVRVVANNVSAVDGRNAGAQVEVITKSGTNEFHGGATYFFQNNTLSTRNIFEPSVAVFRRNQFGYTFGGPILRNRTFFFTSYEGLRTSGGRGQVVTVETEAFRDFLMQTRPNSIAAKLFRDFRPAVYPTFNLRDLGSPRPGVNTIGPADGIADIGNANFTPATTRTADQFQGRIDHELRPGKDRLHGSYYRNDGNSLDPSIRPALNRGFYELSQFADLNETHTFGPTLINEVRAGVIRLKGGNDVPAHLEVPNISITSTSGFSMGQFPNGWRQTNWSFKDVLSWVHSSHTFKMGGEYRRNFSNNNNTSNFVPSYSFQNILDFADDEALQMQRSVDPRTGTPATVSVGVRNREWALFFNDDWKVNRNLSLTLGLRYEQYRPMTDSNNRLTNFIYGSGNDYFTRYAAGRVDFVPELYRSDNNNFSPRFGFAWDPSGNGRMSVRGGYGLSFDRIFFLRAAGYASNPPLIGTATLGPQFGTTFTYTLGNVTQPNLGYPVDPGLQVGLDERNGIRGARVALSKLDPDITSPYVHNWFFGIQRELPGRWIAEINYTGSSGHHLLATYNSNRYAGDMLDGRFDGLNPSFGTVREIETASNSNYHGANARVRREFRGGLLFQGTYTFGKAIADVDDGGATNVYMDANNHRLDRSVTAYDVRHQVSMLGVWELPFLRGNQSWAGRLLGGWLLSGFTTLQTGMPISIVNNAAWPAGDYNADNNSLDRPNAPVETIARSGYSRSSFLTGLFTASAFPVPVRGTNGNLGRNAFRGPGFAQTDLSLSKRFRATERLAAQIRVDAFNAFNRVNLSNPVTDLSNNNFGRSTSADTPRVLQLGLRVEF